MKRILWAAFGVWFLLIGLVLVIVMAIAVIKGQLIFLLGLLPAGSAVLMGLLVLWKFAYCVTWDDTGIDLAFVFRRERVRWEDVESYRKLTLRQKFAGGEANVYTFLRFLRPGKASSKAILLLPGAGPAFSLSAREYSTPLDQHVPHKRAGGA